MRKKCSPLRIKKQSKIRHVNLIMLKKGSLYHYCLIKNLDGLIYNLPKYKGRLYISDYCLQRFSSQSGLENHLEYCKQHKT